MASRWPDSLVDETRAVDVPGYGAEWLTLLRCYTQVNAQWTWLIMCNFRDMAIFHLSINLRRLMDKSSPFCPFF